MYKAHIPLHFLCCVLAIYLAQGKRKVHQSFPQEKIIAGHSVFIAGHIGISCLIFSTFQHIFDHLMDIIAGRSGIQAGR